MAVSQSGQKQFRHIESGLLRILVGAPLFLAARNPQRRAFTQFASQLGKKKQITNDWKTPPAFLCPNFSRHLSTSVSSPKSTGFLNWYLRKLESNPVITKCVSASLIYTSADFTSQIITMPTVGSFDMFRLTRQFSYALMITGPCQHYWFGFLSKIMPQKSLFTTCAKMLMAQTIYGPFMTSMFFSYNAALRGENQYEIMARLKRDLLPTLKNSVLYWPFCDFMTFKFVPVHLQPLVTSSLAYLWIIYVSYMASLKKVGEDEISEYACSTTTSSHTILTHSGLKN